MSKQTQANRIEPNRTESKTPKCIRVVLSTTLLKPAKAILLQHRESDKHGAQYNC